MRKIFLIFLLLTIITCLFILFGYGYIRFKGCTNCITQPFNRLIAYGTQNQQRDLQPVLPLDLFPEHVLFENNYQQIRDEILQYMSKFQPLSANQSSSITFGSGFAYPGWKVVMLRFYNQEYPKIQQYFPQTMRLLNQCADKVRFAMFSILQPKQMIGMHTGPFRGAMRYHLGLSIPEDCHIELAGVKHRWKSGKSLLFDDTFPHRVYNNSNEVRIILFLDVIRQSPSLVPWVSWINRVVTHSPLMHFFAQLNEANELPIPIPQVHNNPNIS